MSAETTTSAAPKPARPIGSNGGAAAASPPKVERKVPERIPRSEEFAAQSKVLNILQRLPEEKRARVIRAVVGLLGV